MENLMQDISTENFKIAEKPVCSSRSSFPYGSVVRTLKLLESSKSIVFDEKEIKSNNVAYLREIMKKQGLPELRQCRVHNKVHLWINRS